MKYYDKDLYEKENILKTTLLIIVIFLLGFATGCIALCDQLQEKEQTIVNQRTEINEVYESEGE